jgi:MFS family permease
MVTWIRAGVSRSLGFIRRQKPNYQVGVIHSSANSLLMGITSQYTAIYAVGLGADSVQLGSLSSIGSALSTLISIPVGWSVDRHGVRRFFLLGIALSVFVALLYAVAQSWQLLIIAAPLAAVALRLTNTGCSVICADSVKNPDRATAQNVCGSISSVVAMISPLIAATLITAFGGMNVEGIRPLFYLRVVGYGLVFLLVARRLREPQVGRHAGADGPWGFVTDFGQLFAGRPGLRRWIAISALNALPMAMF